MSTTQVMWPEIKRTAQAALTMIREHRAVLSILMLATLVLTLAEYFLIPLRFSSLFPDLLRRHAPGVWHGSAERAISGGETGSWWGQLAPFAWWILGLTVIWVLLPWLWSRHLGFQASDLGFRLKGLRAKLGVYALLFLPIGIGIVWVSGRPDFLETYPMLRPAQATHWSWVLLLAFWALYALQFICVEFFFRGYLLFTLERSFGPVAVGISVIPYCMIHYHKPLPEVLGAIVAGFVLGWLALETRSIWGGVLLHVAVALSMDVAALARSPIGFPTTWLP
jgi:membrane protease YdiL (CAAX protease family)